MAKIQRINHKIFGSNAGTNQMGKFGSLAAGSPEYLNDIMNEAEDIMALGNYLTGWFGAVMGNNSPAIQDMNALQFLNSYQLGYLFQSGVAEWNEDTVYYIGSFCNVGGVLYVSKTDDNEGNDPESSPDDWKIYNNAGVLSAVQNMSTRQWQDVSSGSQDQYGVCWAPALGLFIIVGDGTDVLRSADGITWSTTTLGFSHTWNSVAWSPTLGRLVAVGGADAQSVMHSTNGTSWTRVASTDNAETWLKVIWVESLAKFVAVGAGGAVMTSTNGTSWTAATSLPDGLTGGFLWSEEKQLFVGTIFTGGLGKIVTSPDLVAWTQRAVPVEITTPYGLAYSPELEMFVLGNNGSGDYAVSSDAITWVLGEGEIDDPQDITWADSLSLFISCGSRVSTSAYGDEKWIRRSTSTLSNLMDLCWSEELSLCVVVGLGGEIGISR